MLSLFWMVRVLNSKYRRKDGVRDQAPNGTSARVHAWGSRYGSWIRMAPFLQLWFIKAAVHDSVGKRLLPAACGRQCGHACLLACLRARVFLLFVRVCVQTSAYFFLSLAFAGI